MSHAGRPHQRTAAHPQQWAFGRPELLINDLLALTAGAAQYRIVRRRLM
jgi:hypothetical protein